MKLFFATALLLTSSAFAKGVDPSHQACKSDSECQLATLACGCIHNSTCAGPTDKESGIIDAVNKAHAKDYESMSNCTPAETKSCSRAGACPMRGTWIVKCVKLACVAEFKERE